MRSWPSASDGSVHVLQLAARRVRDDLRPGLIGFAHRHGVGVARSAVASQRFVRRLGHVRSAHHHRHAGGADRVGHPVGLGDHAGHRADADQADLLVEHEADQLGIAHRLRIAVDQQDFVPRRGERLQQKHPQVRHEIAGHAVVRIVK